MRTRKEEMTGWRGLAKTVAISVAIGLVAAAVLLFLAAALMTAVDLPEEAISPIAMAALGIGSLISGIMAAKRTGKNGLIVGTMCGLAIFLLTLITGLSIFQTAQTGSTLFKLAISALCGAIGGVLGVGGKTHR